MLSTSAHASGPGGRDSTAAIADRSVTVTVTESGQCSETFALLTQGRASIRAATSAVSDVH